MRQPSAMRLHQPKIRCECREINAKGAVLRFCRECEISHSPSMRRNAARISKSIPACANASEVWRDACRILFGLKTSPALRSIIIGQALSLHAAATGLA